MRRQPAFRSIDGPSDTSAMRGWHGARLDWVTEEESVWMRFKVAGTHTMSMYGIPPTGKVVEVAEIGTAKFVHGKWARSWYLGDEVGTILQLGLSPNILLSQPRSAGTHQSRVTREPIETCSLGVCGLGQQPPPRLRC